MLSFETGASAAVGVAISVTTIPASAYLGVAIGAGGLGEACGALVVLAVNVTLLILSGTPHAAGSARLLPNRSGGAAPASTGGGGSGAGRSQARPGAGSGPALVVDDLGAGECGLPSRARFAEDDAEEADPEGDDREAEADQALEARAAAAVAARSSRMPRKRIPGVCPASAQKPTR